MEGDYLAGTEPVKSHRYRLNISTSVKGVVTPEYTFEAIGWSQEDFWKEQEKFAAEVNKRYPVIKEEAK